jgi:hypothetical protein
MLKVVLQEVPQEDSQEELDSLEVLDSLEEPVSPEELKVDHLAQV